MALFPPTLVISKVEESNNEILVESRPEMMRVVATRKILTSVVSNNEVDFGAKWHFEMPMAHEVEHLNHFDNAHFRDGLFVMT